MEKIIEKLIDEGLKASLNIIYSVLILVIGFKVIKFIIKLIEKGKAFQKLEKSVQSFIKSFVSIVLKIVVFVAILNILGVPMSSVITILGSAGLALGLALQGGLSNIAGGIIILAFKPFKIGDYIKTGSEEGTVSDISVFHTILTTIDNKEVVLPNGNLANSVIINYTANKKRRLDLKFSIEYGEDIDKVKTILNDIALNHELVLKDEDITVKLSDYADSAIIMILRVWVKTDDYWDVNFDIMEEVNKRFKKAKINIPFNQLDVHLQK